MAQRTIYKYSPQLGRVISKNVPDFDVNSYMNRGWMTDKNMAEAKAGRNTSPEKEQNRQERQTQEPNRQEEENQIPQGHQKIEAARYSSLYNDVMPGPNGNALYGEQADDDNVMNIKKQMIDKGINPPENVSTNLDDVYNTFTRIKGYEPSTPEDWQNVANLTQESPNQVEDWLQNTEREQQTTVQNTWFDKGYREGDIVEQNGKKYVVGVNGELREPRAGELSTREQQTSTKESRKEGQLSDGEIRELYKEYGLGNPTDDEIDAMRKGDTPLSSQQALENALQQQKQRVEKDTGTKMEGDKERRWISPDEFDELQQKYKDNPQKIKEMTETVTDDNGVTHYYWKKDVYENMSSDQKPGGTTLTPKQIREQFQAYGYTPTAEDIQWWTNKDQNTLSTLQQNLADRRQQQKQEERQAAQSGEKVVGKSYFQGDEALIRFADKEGIDEGTIWLVRPDDKTIRPFWSRDAFQKRYGKTPEEVIQEGKVKTVTNNYLSDDAILGDYDLQKDKRAVGESGTYQRTKEEEERAADNQQQGQNQGQEEGTEFDPTKIMNTYGEKSNEALNKQTFKFVDKGIFNWLKKMGKENNGGISDETIKQISNDQDTVATYVNALAYGDYNVSDIYRDIKRRELKRQGQDEYKDMKVIDEATKASDFYNKPENQDIRTNPDLDMPDSLGDIDSSLLDNPVFDIPDDVYKTLVQPFDWNSKEGREALDQIKSAYHDVLLQQLDAKSEQQKALADKAYQDFVEQTERNYGIKLSNDTMKAWNKINNLDKQARNMGIGSSGIAREMKQQYLQDVRAGQKRMKENKARKMEAQRE
ncbi:hypothetical protein AKJ56_01515, partial [candidate division MSBL1 archaeon SCGC-AAA382N08]